MLPNLVTRYQARVENFVLDVKINFKLKLKNHLFMIKNELL